MRLLTDSERQAVWDRIERDFRFRPSLRGVPFRMRQKHAVFSLPCHWTEEQEGRVNDIFCSLGGAAATGLYALDWQHDCFLFDPRERLPVGLSWHDAARDCNVYFPQYDPDGDYHFFIAQDFSCGMLGHPWRRELWVFGDELIEALRNQRGALGLREKGLLRTHAR